MASLPAQELRRRAIARALANGGAAAVRRVRFGLYAVASASRPELQHRVRVIGANWFCSCEASLGGRPCWHAAAVYVAKLEHAMGGKGRVTGPAAAASAVEAPAPQGGGKVVDIRSRLPAPRAA